ncbi:MAG TPA: ABC transporter permease, partial [Bryobacteraceae bacterium]|nr:ABC transporter permease [Bryobacteraceae bacterium]
MTLPLRHTFRTLARTPAFTITAIAALALGIGANTAIFSLVNQVLLNPPGMSHPERVIAERVNYDKLNLKSIGVSVPDFEDMHRSRQVFEHAALMSNMDFNYTGAGAPQRLQGATVSVEWFDVFGAKPRLGRAFTRAEDRPEANNVVVLAWSTWVRLFGRDPGVLNRVIELNQKPYRIIGVMGPDFRWPKEAEVWAPLGLANSEYDEGNRFNESYNAVARLKPGVSFAQANALIHVLAARERSGNNQAAAYARDSAWGMFAVRMTDFVAGDTKQPMLILLGAVGFVLLIACSNIAGLMIARASGRGREIAVRAALGAGRWQLLRGTVQESFVLAIVGAIAGLAVAWGGMRLLLLIAPEAAVNGLEPRLDGLVLLFTGILAIICGLLFGIAPAWQIARTDRHENLRGGGR